MAIDLMMLLRAYAMGIFPMADSRDDPDIFWVEPKRRAVLPLDGLHLSRSLRRALKSGHFTITANQAFGDVIAHCWQPTNSRPDSWINPLIENACLGLNRIGHAHSIECWLPTVGGGQRLVGGLYGISLGTAFFGESMFSRATNASKVALACLVARLKVGGFTLLDCQLMTDHLRSLGAVEISQSDYLSRLGAAVDGVVLDAAGASAASWIPPDSPAVLADFGALDTLLAPVTGNTTVSAPVSSQLIVQLLTQAS